MTSRKSRSLSERWGLIAKVLAVASACSFAVAAVLFVMAVLELMKERA